MPYALRGNTVIRSDTGAVVKKHPTRAHALAHLKALKVNVEAQEAEWRWLDEHAEEWLSELDSEEHGMARTGAARLSWSSLGGAGHGMALAESERTAMLAVTPKPFSASRTSNWIARLGGLPPYIQQVAHGILKSGKTESRAITMAIGVMKNWASGRGKVSPEVRAAAAAALAQWESMKAASRAKSAVKAAGGTVSRAASGSKSK